MGNTRLFFLGFGKASLSLALLLDINMNSIPSSHGAVASELRDRSNQEPTVASAVVANPRLRFKIVFGFQCGAPGLANHRFIESMENTEE